MPGLFDPDKSKAKPIFKNVDAFNRLLCPKCNLLLHNPVQPSCGHRICQSCADDILQLNAAQPMCPVADCGERFEREDGAYYFPDRFIRREINSLEVICPFSKEGCNWEGKFGEYANHENRCEFQPMPDLKNFPINASPTQSLNGELVQLCRRSTESYMDSHELSVKHLQENTHDHLAMQSNHLQMLVEKLLHLEQSLARTGFQSHVAPSQQRNSEIENLIFDEIQRVQSTLTLSLQQEVQARDEELASLKSQVTKLEKQNRSRNAELEDRDFRLSLIENSNYDGSMIWKIPQFSQRKADAENGKRTSIFSLPFYSGRYGYKMCLRLYMIGDGIGKGTHLSLLFVVMRGEFDNILQWPFTHKVTFKLINQAGGRDIVDTFQPDPTSSSFRKPKSDMNIASGCPQFVSHVELEGGGFIVDDTIFIKCMIDTSTICHP